jgi:hypothetical protein
MEEVSYCSDPYNVQKTIAINEIIKEDGELKPGNPLDTRLRTDEEDTNALVLSSVLGTTQLSADEKKSITVNSDDDAFNFYLEEDKLIRFINELVLNEKPNITLVQGIKTDIPDEKIARIALVLARNHDLCEQVYGDKTIGTNYTFRTCQKLVASGMPLGIIQGQYKLVHGVDIQLGNSPQTTTNTQTTATRSIFERLIAISVRGGASNKKKTQPKDKNKKKAT